MTRCAVKAIANIANASSHQELFGMSQALSRKACSSGGCKSQDMLPRLVYVCFCAWVASCQPCMSGFVSANMLSIPTVLNGWASAV